MLLVIIYGIIVFGIGYLVIKTAVKNAIIEAHKELNQPVTVETIENKDEALNECN